MKITGVKIMAYSAPYKSPYPSEARSCGPLDIYPEYAARERNPHMRGIGGAKDGEMTNAFIVITTDEGIEGVHGPISYRAQLMVAVDGLREHLVGRNPLENRLVWDIMSRFDRHARSGLMLRAISCADIALWDLKGKLLGLPVYKILGGGRGRIKPYISTLAFSVEPQRARERALWLRDLGFGAQKW